MLGTTRGLIWTILPCKWKLQQRGEMSTVYRLTKPLCRQIDGSLSIVNHKEGNPMTAEDIQAKRWVEHFSEVLIENQLP